MKLIITTIFCIIISAKNFGQPTPTAGRLKISIENIKCINKSWDGVIEFDAWKIQGVTVTLEFRDQNGNLHPSLGQKTITFSNANGFLNGYNGTLTMICNTDGYLNPLSAYIE